MIAFALRVKIDRQRNILNISILVWVCSKFILARSTKKWFKKIIGIIPQSGLASFVETNLKGGGSTDTTSEDKHAV